MHDYDLRWAAVFGREAGTPLSAKSTLQLFRSHLIIFQWDIFLFLPYRERLGLFGSLGSCSMVSLPLAWNTDHLPLLILDKR